MSAPREVLASRDAPRSAAARCLAYAACSELLASPHEVDPRPALRERLALGEGCPAARVLVPPCERLAAAPLDRLRDDYSSLFEIGSEGPPAPIREHLADGSGTRALEEIVRYYEHFGYALGEQFAWQPDHLSVELEFMHYLCFREFQSDDPAAAQPLQLGQADFATRHLVNWVPGLATRVATLAADSAYAGVVAAIAEFAAADAAWQFSTIRETPAG
jgi:DMSO reductase family type II enzyme chaperone